MMEKLAAQIEQLVLELGYYLYDVVFVREHGEYVLRVMIENDTEITLDDCVDVSRAIGDLLDQDDPFTEPYNLEVTSPGAERILHTNEQIARSVGKMVHVETFEQQFTGKLMSYQNGILELKMNDKKTTKIDEMDVNLIRLTIVL